MDEEIVVEFYGGESRQYPGKACNYMVSLNGDSELYAEHIVETDDEMEGYDELKSSILKQAHGACVIFR